ncbi:MAG TPA: hypothetical protein VGG84_01100 [Gemmatimonadaceae bacterium]
MKTLALALVACGSVGLGAQNPPPPPTAPPPADTTSAVRRDTADVYLRMTIGEYANRVVGPRALLRDVAIAGFDQLTGHPKEWPRTWRGYGDRASSRLGTGVIAQAVVFGVSNLLDERPAHFTLCQCTGTRPRLEHALLVPLRMNTPNGPHFSLLAPMSEIGSSILITSMHPGGFSVRDGLIGGAVGVSGSALGAVAREFWPWKRRPFGI